MWRDLPALGVSVYSSIMPTIDLALSIGPNCRAKYHLRRKFGACAPSGIFDWQVTPPAAIHAYLERDFQGLFELDDLQTQDGIVWNSRFGTSHEHEFPAGIDDLERHYARARARHDHLCRNTRRYLTGDRRLLLGFSRPVPTDVVAGIRAQVVRYSPQIRCELVAEPEGLARSDDWKGNLRVWDELLAPYTVRPLERTIAEMAGVARLAGRVFGRLTRGSATTSP